MKKSAREIVDSSRLIARRGLMLGAIQVAVVATLGWRLKTMQLDRADEFRLLSDGNSIKLQLLPPARGLIHDRNGILLAGNEANYRATITRAEAGDTAAVIARLRHLIPMTDTAVAALLADIGRRSAVKPVVVADRLTWEQFSSIAVNAPALPGVTPEAGLSRSYPRGGDFAHVLGYVGPVSDYDLS